MNMSNRYLHNSSYGPLTSEKEACATKKKDQHEKTTHEHEHEQSLLTELVIRSIDQRAKVFHPIVLVLGAVGGADDRTDLVRNMIGEGSRVSVTAKASKG
jgi:hypothetical protein